MTEILVQPGITTQYYWMDETGKQAPFRPRFDGTHSEIEKTREDKGFLVLSLDGGGVRGYLQVCLLADLESKLGPDARIGEIAHLIGGTSVGGLLTMLLLKRDPANPNRCQYSARWLKDNFQSLAEEVFDRKPESLLWKIFKTVFGIFFKVFGIFWDIDHPEYSRAGLISIGEKYLQGELAKNARTHFCIATYELGKKMRTLFVSKENAGEGFFRNITMAELGTITSAAPVFFDPAPYKNGEFMDGGIWCNDPSLAAFQTAQKVAPMGRKIHVLSLGTGITPTAADSNPKRKHWGLLQIVPSLIDLFMNSQTQGVNEEMKQQEGLASYHRFQPVMANAPSLDAADPKTWALLDNVAQEIIQSPQWAETVNLWKREGSNSIIAK